jgi:hypothetical protein
MLELSKALVELPTPALLKPSTALPPLSHRPSKTRPPPFHRLPPTCVFHPFISLGGGTAWGPVEGPALSTASLRGGRLNRSRRKLCSVQLWVRFGNPEPHSAEDARNIRRLFEDARDRGQRMTALPASGSLTVNFFFAPAYKGLARVWSSGQYW